MHEWIPTSGGQTLAQLVAAQEALGNTVLLQDADNSRVLVDAPSGSSGLANAVVYKGATDCSGNPNYPAASAGDMYIVSVAGKIGGASGVSVEAGDSFICKTDGTAAGTQAQRGTAWNVVQGNLAGPIPVKATGAEVNTGTDDDKFVTPKAVEDSDYAKTAAIPVKASGAEVDTGVDDAKFVTALALTNSDYIKEADLPAGGITNSAPEDTIPMSDGDGNLIASPLKLLGGSASGVIQIYVDTPGDNADIDLLPPDGDATYYARVQPGQYASLEFQTGGGDGTFGIYAEDGLPVEFRTDSDIAGMQFRTNTNARGGGNLLIDMTTAGGLGFFGTTGVARPEVPATPTEQDIVTALVALGLVTQAEP